jgi:hypothetical protein
LLQTTSRSTAAAASDQQWRHFSRLFLSMFFGVLAAIFISLLLIDPFDSGRSPFSIVAGVFDGDPRIAGASLGRDPRFNSAVLGNSHGQALNPTRLSLATGLSFVQLTVPGTGPREQLTLLRWFVDHHAKVGGIVLVVDEWWCGQDPNLPLQLAFPFWLYGGFLDYLPHLLSPRALDRAGRRLGLALGFYARSDPTGFMDYEADRTWAFSPGTSEPPSAQSPSTLVGPLAFPAIERLAAAVADLPPTVPVVIVIPPVFYTSLPLNGSSAAVRFTQCQAALTRSAGQRPHGELLDFRVESDLTRDPRNFMDATHYRSEIAHMMEKRIAATLAEIGESR